MCLLTILMLIVVAIVTIFLALLFDILTLGGLAWWSTVLGIFSEISIVVAFLLFAELYSRSGCQSRDWKVATGSLPTQTGRRERITS